MSQWVDEDLLVGELVKLRDAFGLAWVGYRVKDIVRDGSAITAVTLWGASSWDAPVRWAQGDGGSIRALDDAEMSEHLRIRSALAAHRVDWLHDHRGPYGWLIQVFPQRRDQEEFARRSRGYRRSLARPDR